VNLLTVARWYNSQEAIVRSFLDQNEPLTWLKHLHRHHSSEQSRLPWLLTAGIIEEYSKAHSRPEALMATIPEDATLTEDMTLLERSPSMHSQKRVRSRPVSLLSLEATRSRTRSNDPYEISFEPSIDSKRHSARSTNIYSMDYRADSPRSSLSSINIPRLHSHDPSPVHSPTSSLAHLRDLAKRFRGRGHESDDGRSSTRESLDRSSMSDDGRSRSAPIAPTQKHPRDITRPATLEVQRSPEVVDNEEAPWVVPRPEETSDAYAQALSTARLLPPDTAKQTMRPPLEYKRSQTEPHFTVPREAIHLATPRAMRISLPSSAKPHHLPPATDRQQTADEEREREAYERKSRFVPSQYGQSRLGLIGLADCWTTYRLRMQE
jgi:hypothetical protein